MAESQLIVPAQGEPSQQTHPPSSSNPTPQETRKPAWSESYSNCTILVAKIANLRARYSIAAEDEMLFLHTIKEQFDNVTIKHNEVMWKARAGLYFLVLPMILTASVVASPIHRTAALASFASC